MAPLKYQHQQHHHDLQLKVSQIDLAPISNVLNSSIHQCNLLTLRSPAHHHFLAGLLTGSFSSLLLQPADLLKTRLQQSPDRTTLLPTLRGILAQPNAVRNLWRGTLPSVIRTGVGSALYFSSLNALRTRVATSSALISLPTRNPNGQSTVTTTLPTGDRPSASSILPTLSKTQNLLTGAMARAWAGFIMMPITVLKVRYESSLYAYPSLLAASRDVFRREGIRGFLAGYGATAVRDAPYAGLYVVFYESCKGYLGRISTQPTSPQTGVTRETATINPTRSMPINFLSGALAATAATTVTNPFDAVKTRLQLMPGRYGNMFRAGIMMVRGEGVRSLFDGLGLRVGRKAISSALAWTGYEEVVRRVGSGR